MDDSGIAVTALGHSELLTRLAARHGGPAPRGVFRRAFCDDRHDALSADDSADALFIAVRGARHDSHFSIQELVRRGFNGGVVVERPVPSCGLPLYQVESTRRAVSVLAHAFAGDPGRELRTFGITGTNGKSTTVRMLAAMLEAAGESCGWSGTVTSRFGEREVRSRMTTPEPQEIVIGMREHVRAGGRAMVLEVSSHALDQERVAGLTFSGAALTNLSRDHYDYHGSRTAYLDAKLRLFEQLAPGVPAVLPADNDIPMDHPRLRGREILTFAGTARRGARIAAHADRLVLDTRGMRGEIRVLDESIEIDCPLIGRFNLLNLLAAALVARLAGVSAPDIAKAVHGLVPVRGRLEPVPAGGGQVYVDYAHTPDALAAVLGSARELTQQRLVVVFGCGGDRDRGKRPLMGQVAERLADRVIITTDNPRSEDAGSICAEITAGMGRPERVAVELDRRRAIRFGLSEIAPGDVLVVAGKGHEREQYVGANVLPFDDFQVIEEMLAEGKVTCVREV
ncbi:MAG: UDP-N-acetylmuramoyl-L-alanyl-D-glutamate--2,6-diaminopimelate ligase [Planctomycetota bacterium]